jgi:hypothetical protein
MYKTNILIVAGLYFSVYLTEITCFIENKVSFILAEHTAGV